MSWNMSNASVAGTVNAAEGASVARLSRATSGATEETLDRGVDVGRSSRSSRISRTVEETLARGIGVARISRAVQQTFARGAGVAGVSRVVEETRARGTDRGQDRREESCERRAAREQHSRVRGALGSDIDTLERSRLPRQLEERGDEEDDDEEVDEDTESSESSAEFRCGVEEEEEEEEEDDDDDDEEEEEEKLSSRLPAARRSGAGRSRGASLDADDDDDEEEEDNDEEVDNMVAAMNEHLSGSSATSSASTTAAAAATTTTTAAVTSTPATTNNGCTRSAVEEAVEEDGKPAAASILGYPCDFDHMYASMTDGGAPATSALGVSPLRGNEPRQNDLTEVKHLKELLLLHLDLIQQQSEQIVTKDKLLAALRQENETLKLRLERMDRRVNLQKLRSESSENSITSEHVGTCSPPNVNSSNIPSSGDLHRNIQTESNNPQYNESFKIRLNTSGGITTVKQEIDENEVIEEDIKQEAGNESRFEWDEKKKRKSDPTPLTSSKRKRGVSCSSTVSNDASSTTHSKTSNHDVNRKTDRKGKCFVKKESFLTTEEHYYTAVGEPGYTLSLKESNPAEANGSLEVPNWRVKIYTSCYTMEGTENLDDEIFNKRHLKLENDERRRKRWDVQRIREQRHIEKLKQRQERQNHQPTCYHTNHTGPCPSGTEEEAVTSLWPDIEQIQSLQIDSQLPVTAFGAPIPTFTPSEFSLPWSNTVRTKSRRPKRSTGRRKSKR